MIYSYNHYLIQHHINSNFLNRYKSEHFEEWYPIYRNFPLEGWSDYPEKDSRKNLFASTSFFLDRTKTIPHYLKIHYDSPLPQIRPFNLSFFDISSTACQLPRSIQP